jgi:DNA-binding NarL/FixJ family response regulator
MARGRSARKPVRILVADDHPLVRNALCTLLKLQPGFSVVGEAADGDEAIQLVQTLRPDVLLLDLSMPRMDGMDVLRELAETRTPVKTVVLTGAIEPETTQEVLRLGARGVVLKESSTALLCKCVRTVMAGEVWVEPERHADFVQSLLPTLRARPK